MIILKLLNNKNYPENIHLHNNNAQCVQGALVLLGLSVSLLSPAHCAAI